MKIVTEKRSLVKTLLIGSMPSLLKVALSQKVLDSFFIANFAINNIPFYYLKLLHPLQGSDKMSIVKRITFTCTI